MDHLLSMEKEKRNLKYLTNKNILLSFERLFSQKYRPSSDCSLQLDYTKLESLVIANQHVAVNTFPGLVHTARHTMGVDNARSP